MNFTKEERDSYEEHLKWLCIEANTLKKARREGKEEGRVEGKAELIKMMIENGSSIEEVAKITKLSVAKITELLKTLNGGLSDKL